MKVPDVTAFHRILCVFCVIEIQTPKITPTSYIASEGFVNYRGFLLFKIFVLIINIVVGQDKSS